MILRKDIEDLARLSRLTPNEAEIGGLQGEFDAILGYVGQIRETSLGPREKLPPVRNVMREDLVIENAVGGSQKSLLSEVPRREGDYIVVRKILRKEESEP